MGAQIDRVNQLEKRVGQLECLFDAFVCGGAPWDKIILERGLSKMASKKLPQGVSRIEGRIETGPAGESSILLTIVMDKSVDCFMEYREFLDDCAGCFQGGSAVLKRFKRGG